MSIASRLMPTGYRPCLPCAKIFAHLALRIAQCTIDIKKCFLLSDAMMHFARPHIIYLIFSPFTPSDFHVKIQTRLILSAFLIVRLTTPRLSTNASYHGHRATAHSISRARPFQLRWPYMPRHRSCDDRVGDVLTSQPRQVYLGHVAIASPPTRYYASIRIPGPYIFADNAFYITKCRLAPSHAFCYRHSRRYRKALR